MLPGTDPDAHQGASALEQAARRTLTALWEAGSLGPQHALAMQLVIELSRAVDAGTRAGRASAVAMAAAQLRETWQALLPEDSGPTADAEAHAALMKDIRQAAGLPAFDVVPGQVAQ